MNSKKRSPLFIFIFILTISALGLLLFKTSKQNSQIANSKTAVKQTIRRIAKEINDDCQKKGAKCFEESTRVRLLDVYPTLQILDAIYDYDTYFSCHAFTHFLGRTLYQKTESIPDSYSQINFTCHGGTYHGVIEAYLEKSNWQKEPESIDIENVCRDSRTKTDKNPEAVFTECLHGFGHAFMFVTNSDLPKSLNLCNSLSTNLQERCWGGAFMENSTSSTNRNHPTEWLKAEDKFFPCTILEQKYLNQCYFYQANYLIMITNYNFQKVFADCYTLSGNQKDYCIMGIGAILASVSNEKGIETAAAVCNLAKDRSRIICIEGAIPSLMQRYGGEVEKLVKFCQLNPEDLKPACFAKLGILSKIWHNQDQVAEICSLDKDYQKYCTGETKTTLYFN